MDSKMKVLGLQELAQVSGGRRGGDLQPADWSTASEGCGGVHTSEWSTMSNNCRGDHREIQ